jgi:hypothetical protein
MIKITNLGQPRYTRSFRMDLKFTPAQGSDLVDYYATYSNYLHSFSLKSAHRIYKVDNYKARSIKSVGIRSYLELFSFTK